MAENKGRRIGCLVGCLALGLIGVAGVGAVGLLVVGGAGAGAYFVTAGGQDISKRFDEIAKEVEVAPPAPVVVPAVEVPTEVTVDGVPAADGANQAGVTGTTDGTDATTTDGTATDGTVSPAPSSSGTADVAPAPSPSPGTTTTTTTTTRTSPSPSPSPSPAPMTRTSPSPSPAPVPAPMTRATGGKVTVEGGASVVLIGADGKRHTVPGSVPSGSYQMEATFSDGVPVNVGKLTVEEGGSHTVRCNENMGICRGS